MYAFLVILNFYFRLSIVFLNPNNWWHWRLPVQGFLNELYAAGIFYLALMILWIVVRPIRLRQIVFLVFVSLWTLVNFANFQYANSFNVLLPLSWFYELENMGEMGSLMTLILGFVDLNFFLWVIIPIAISFYLTFKKSGSLLLLKKKRHVIYVILISAVAQNQTLYPDIAPRHESTVQSHLLKNWYYNYEAKTAQKLRTTPLPDFSDDFKKIVLEESSENHRLIPQIKSKTPNVILLMLESFRAYELGAYGSKLGLSPNFDRLAKKGVLFTNLYSAYHLTKIGQWSILCGAHPHNGKNVLKNYQDHGVKCFPEHLTDRGYDSWWFHGQGASYDFQGYFLKHHSVNHIMDRLTFPQEAKLLGWGISDEDLVKHSLNHLKQAQTPYFAIIQSQTNHHPFEVEKDFFVNYGYPDSINSFFNTLRYTDAMMGRFVNEIRKTPAGKNALIIITADHGLGKDLVEKERNLKPEVLLKYQVPLLLLYPEGEFEQPMVIDTLGGQPDIMPTLLDILNIKPEFPVFGKSLIRKYKHRFATGQSGGRWMTLPNRFYRQGPKRSVMDWQGKQQKITPLDKQMFKLLVEIDDIQDWIIQQTDVEKTKAGLVEKGWNKFEQ